MKKIEKVRLNDIIKEVIVLLQGKLIKDKRAEIHF